MIVYIIYYIYLFVLADDVEKKSIFLLPFPGKVRCIAGILVCNRL